jgi:activating signal cointegrator 1
VPCMCQQKRGKEEVKAISLLQPWAQLVVLGEKIMETRTWPTNYRGPLAIHASRRSTNVKTLAGQQPFRSALTSCFKKPSAELAPFYGPPIWVVGNNVAEPVWLPLGAVVGYVQLVDCILMTESWLRCISPRERAFGHYEEGRWAWVLASPQTYEQPVPARGQLGLWDWEWSA